MRYTLTGNFQYDLGIFGLKKVLDFFNEPYKTDENFYIEVDKKPEEILELVLLYKFYFHKNKFTGLFSKLNIDIENLKVFTKFSDLEQHFPNFNEIKRDFYKKLALIFQNEFLNLFNPSKLKYINEFEDIKNIIIDNIKNYHPTKKVCSFCNKNSGTALNRMYFFLAPSNLNAFWMNEPSIYICEYCAISDLAISASFTYIKKDNRKFSEKEALAVYRPNLSDLENLNTLKITDIGQLTQKIIEYEKLNLKREATLKDLQILEFYLDAKNPNLEFYLLTDDILENILKLQDSLNKLYTTYKDSLWGQIKDKSGYITVNLSKEILKFISTNQKLFYLVLKYAKLSMMAESFRQKEREGKIKKQNIPVKGFFVNVLLEILKMHFILEGLKMNHFKAFKEYGLKLRRKVGISLLNEVSDYTVKNWYSELKKLGKINTFNNKIIALSNSFLDASKGSFEQFMETLTRVIISYDAPITADHLSYMNKENYREIATVIALSVMTEKSRGDKAEKTEVNQAKGEAI